MKTGLRPLPEGWKLVRVSECLKLQNGYAFKPEQWSKRGDPIVRIQNLNNPEAPFNFFDGELPDKFRAETGDLFFAWSGTPGTSFGAHVWKRGPAWINQHIFRVDFSEEDFDRDFLRLALNFNLDSYISQAQGGVGLAHITKAKLNNSELVVPPLKDQRSIAQTIAVVERNKEESAVHIAAAAQLTRQFRSTALTAAYQSAAADQEGEGLAPLSSILSEPPRNGYSAKPVSYTTDTRVLTLTSTTSGFFDPSHFKYTDKVFEVDSPFWAEPGDILIQRGNTAEYVGVPALYEGERNQFIYPDLMIRLRVSEEVSPRYVWYMLLAPPARNFLRGRATGSAGNMPKINQTMLREVPIPLASSSRRAELVDRLDAAFALASAAEQMIGGANRTLKFVPDSVLKKALQGELDLRGIRNAG